MRDTRRTLLLYYVYQTTTSNGFWMPYAYIYLLEQGHSETVFGLANAAFLFTMVAMEIPAGYIGDRYGRRTSLAIGNAIATVVFGLYAFAGKAWQVIGLFTIWGAGYAFHSATGEAWLYDLLAGSNGEKSTADFARDSGRSKTASLLTSAFGALAATPLYLLNPKLPFLANAVLSVVGVPLLGLLPATRTDFEPNFSVRKAVKTLRIQIGRPTVRWLIVYISLFNLLLSMTRWLEQPALKRAGVPLIWFGALYASFQLVSTAGTSMTGWIQEHLGPRWFFLMLAPLVGTVYGLLAFVPAMVFPVIYLRRVLSRVMSPIMNQYLNDQLDGGGRATVLSGASMVLTLTSGIGAAVFGPVSEAMGPLSFLPRAGIAVVSVAVLLWAVTSPVRSLEENDTDSVIKATVDE
ncbi:MFS transporter [Haladaptatus caseinilyticus]|uniref:MFS transporter n=1 Tax=Haladaptatus caseinilyticus TaxID=2993314 RepID=UPI00224B85B6|nr:MFS transporter [Haladaptatus caseinilyticus]